MNCTQVSEVLPPSAVGRLACLTPPKRKDNPFARMLEHAKPEEPATAVTEENESRGQISRSDANIVEVLKELDHFVSVLLGNSRRQQF